MPVWRINVAKSADKPERNYFTEAADEILALAQVQRNVEIADDAKVTVSACV